MPTRRLLCAIPRKRPARWYWRRHAILTGLVVADLILVVMSSAYSQHAVAECLAMGLALVICCQVGSWARPRPSSPPPRPED